MASAPVRRKSPARAKKASAGARLLSLALRHPREILVTALLTGCGGFIAWNALVLQKVRHPAPLFNQQSSPQSSPEAVRPLPPTRPVIAQSEPDPTVAAQPVSPAPVAVAPAAPPRLPSRSAITEMIRNGSEAAPAAQPSPRVASAVAPPPAPSPARAPAMRDPIGEIIRMGGPVPTPPANVGRVETADVTLSGQRALAKLGYGVKADGIMGSGTRQAIERFEHDRNLPVTGEFGPRTARELSSLSGIAVQ